MKVNALLPPPLRDKKDESKDNTDYYRSYHYTPLCEELEVQGTSEAGSRMWISSLHQEKLMTKLVSPKAQGQTRGTRASFGKREAEWAAMAVGKGPVLMAPVPHELKELFGLI
ncbi:hypothetical protein Nmel_013590 [Mimus melanotis]